MAETPAPAPQIPPDDRHWAEKISKSAYFLGALLLHLIVFIMIATWVIFPAFKPPVDDFTKTYLPPSSPPPPPPQAQQTPQVPTHAVSPPTAMITANTPTPTFSVPLPDFTHAATPDAVTQKITAPVTPTKSNLNARISNIKSTVAGWGRDANNVRDSNSDPRAVVAKFPVYIARYANGDWDCNTITGGDGKIVGGSMVNLVTKINEWSHGKIVGEVMPAVNVGGPDLMAKKPPFIFFTGHKDFTLTELEIQNLRDYLQVGGCIWGDNALAGRGSRFDVAFRREMKRVVPDADKNFEPVPMTHDMFDKMGYFSIAKLPTGMNYYQEPVEHLDIDGKLAILYTPNDYSDMMCMRILPGDDKFFFTYTPKPSELNTNIQFNRYSTVFYRNFNLPSCLACQQLGMNIIAYMLVRFDRDIQQSM